MMNNIKLKKNKDVYLKIRSRQGKKNRKAKANLIKMIQKEKEPEITKVQEYLDIALSCDNMFQYIYENKFLNKRYYYTILILTFYTLIMNYLSGFVLLALFRMPDLAYEYECFSLSNYQYQKCTLRDLCYCKSDKICVSVCYDSRLECRDYFIKFDKERSNNIIRSNDISNPTYVRFILDNSKITILNKVDSNYCQINNYCIYLIILLFIGGSIGLFVSGMLADYFGKRKVILGVSLTIIVENIVMILLSEYTVNDYSSLTSFFTTWGIVSFFSGISLFALEYLVLLNFMEFFPDPKSIKYINAYMHSQFTFTNMSFASLNSIIKNLIVFYYISIVFFLAFFFIFLYYIVENPRYYSERRDYNNKMNSFSKIIQNVLVKRDQAGLKKGKEENKDDIGKDAYMKVLIITNTAKNKKSDQPEVNESGNPNQRLLASNKMTRRPNLFKNIDLSLKGDNDLSRVRASINNQKILKKAIIENRKKSVKKWTRREVILDDQRKIIEGLGNENFNSLLKTKKRNSLDLFKIYRKFFRDKYVKKYFFIFTLLWMSVIYCFYGSTFCLLFKLANPNHSKLIESVGVSIYSFLVILLMPFIIGNLSGFVPLDEKYFVMATILIYSLITIFLDSSYIMPDSDRINFFSSADDIAKYKISSISISTATSLIITTVSLFNLLLVTSVPTAYRTVFVSSIKAIGNLIPIFSYLSFKFLDTPILMLGIISLCAFFIFFSLKFKWRDVKLIESVDNEDLYSEENKIKNKSKKEESKRTSKAISHSKTLSNRASIFTRVKHYSIN